MSEPLIVSGEIGLPAYEIDCLMPACGVMVRVQLREEAAQRLIWWHHPEYAGMPFQEIPDLSESDARCDAIRAAVESWVRTFPLAPATGEGR